MAELSTPDISGACDTSEGGPLGSRAVNAYETRALRLEQPAALQIGDRSDGIAVRDRAGRKQQQVPMGLSVKGVEWHMTKAIAHVDRVMRRR